MTHYDAQRNKHMNDMLFWIGNLSFALNALSYLVRDILWLRGLSIAAGFAGRWYNYNIDAGPLWLVIGWLCFFILVNIIQIGLLLAERREVHLEPQAAELRAAAFPSLEVARFRKLMTVAQWQSWPADHVVAKAGSTSAGVFVIASGRVEVAVNGERLGTLTDGDMIGEVARLADRPISADLTTAEPTRVAFFERVALTRFFARNPSIGQAFDRAFIAHLAEGFGRPAADRQEKMWRGSMPAET
jgi:hypothetical protein